MMTSFPGDPAYYMSAYKRRQSIGTTDKTNKMLLLQTKATKKKSRTGCTSEQQLSGELIWREINKTDQALTAKCERVAWADLRLPLTGQPELSVKQSLKQSAVVPLYIVLGRGAVQKQEKPQKQLNLNFMLLFLSRQYFQ